MRWLNYVYVSLMYLSRNRQVSLGLWSPRSFKVPGGQVCISIQPALPVASFLPTAGRAMRAQGVGPEVGTLELTGHFT